MRGLKMVNQYNFSIGVSIVSVYFVDWMRTVFLFLLKILPELLLGSKLRSVLWSNLKQKYQNMNVSITGEAHHFRNLG